MSGTVERLTTASSTSTLAVSKLNCQNKTKFLEKFCFSWSYRSLCLQGWRQPSWCERLVSRSHPKWSNLDGARNFWGSMTELVRLEAWLVGDRTKVAVQYPQSNMDAWVQSLDVVVLTSRKLLANSTQLATMLRAIVWFQSKKTSTLLNG